MKLGSYIQFQYGVWKLFTKLGIKIHIGSFKHESEAKEARKEIELLAAEYEANKKQLVLETIRKIKVIREKYIGRNAHKEY